MSPQDLVREAEAARSAAMLAGDVQGLEGLLSDRLTFVHATGAVDDKPALLKKMAAGGIVYHAIAWSEPQVDLHAGVAAMHGVMTLEVTVGGVAKTLHNRAVLLWEEVEGRWRLFYFQSTPIAQGR
ncbi:nuclear transport factor 2 family protein [Phenylobacterium sp. LjRoot219]|uniref:nuclear transport factor 2 family protein n=1 Tax=Phenylobacterium sp. LjRoot219 TaxID=3342283 RepID=UPI003ED02A7E